jgi:glycosyltransferase involved in cell wall biosynthesis
VPQISLIIPTRNESQTICQCIQRAQEAFKRAGLSAEIIVSDSSTDQTADIAASCGGRVVFPQRLGYGNAYLLGFQEARGVFINAGPNSSEIGCQGYFGVNAYL